MISGGSGFGLSDPTDVQDGLHKEVRPFDCFLDFDGPGRV